MSEENIQLLDFLKSFKKRYINSEIYEINIQEKYIVSIEIKDKRDKTIFFRFGFEDIPNINSFIEEVTEHAVPDHDLRGDYAMLLEDLKYTIRYDKIDSILSN